MPDKHVKLKIEMDLLDRAFSFYRDGLVDIREDAATEGRTESVEALDIEIGLVDTALAQIAASEPPE